MRTKLRNLLLFGAAVASLIIVLKMMNWMPLAVEEGLLRRYSSIDEVKSKLKIKTIYTPAFYPQSLRWPPSQIAAQTKPFTAVVMEFAQKENNDVFLIISQIAAHHSLPDEKIKILRIKETVRYPLKGRDALLVVGVCRDGEPCCRIAWDEEEYRISLVMRSTPINLLKIAESMVH